MVNFELWLNGDLISEQTLDNDPQVGDLVSTGIRYYRVLARDEQGNVVRLDVEPA